MLRKHRKVIIKKSKPSLSQSQEDPSNPDGDDDKAEDLNYDYKCRYCDRSFKKSVSLGGHISKAHNGKSDLYKKKMEIRQSRQQDREYLAQAKDVFV